MTQQKKKMDNNEMKPNLWWNCNLVVALQTNKRESTIEYKQGIS
jgi:hypothetical protein